MTRSILPRAPLGSRSPSKPSSVARDKAAQSFETTDDAAAETNTRTRSRTYTKPKSSSGPQTVTNPPNPEKWSVKDTSVIIASAFHQAANDMQAKDPNSAWASGRTANLVARSTSVEYEHSAQSIQSHRLPKPRSTTTTRKPVSKQASSRHVPDSEPDEESIDHSRAKSPFDHAIDAAKRALAPATYYLRQPAHDSHANGTNGSYDYSAEEREFQAAQNLSNGSVRRVSAAHKRNRIPLDKQAYRPTQSDMEQSDEDVDDQGRKVRRRKKRKNEPVGGPLTSLPVTSYDKKKKKRVRKTNAAGVEEEADSSDEHLSDQHSADQQAFLSNTKPTSRNDSSHLPPNYYDTTHDASVDVEQGLDSIIEVDEAPPPRPRSRSVERQQKRGFSIGAMLGSIVHSSFTAVAAVLAFFWRCISLVFFCIGQILGGILDAVFIAPSRKLSGASSGPIFNLGKYVTIAIVLYASLYMLQEPLSAYLPKGFPVGTSFSAPAAPAADISELSVRLQRLERALSGLFKDTAQSNTRLETTAKTHDDLVSKLSSLEARLMKETLRAAEAEKEVRVAANKGIENVKQDMESLLAQIQAGRSSSSSGELSHDEASAKLKALEERLGSVEGGVKEALEAGKNAGKSGAGAAWWPKFGAPGPKSELIIKSSDGQDVTRLMKDLVESTVHKYSKDDLARPDFALHSGGASVIPSLTSPTLEVKPQTLRAQMVGFLTGNGKAIGRPPVTALHHELHNGHCWPFAGTEGQLGVMLAAPVYITDVTIDHVAKEVAFDLRSAPRDMELWGLVEGKDNIRRVKAWQAERALARKEAQMNGEEPSEELQDPPYPRTLPKSPQYIRIAKFTYNIHAPHNVQTFPVSNEIKELGIDFGIVVLRVKSNWGRAEFSCLYRLRVHGQRLGETPLPPEDPAA